MQLLKQFQNLKFSIRVSIVTLFMLLLSIVGFAIIGINYSALNKILSSSAKNLIQETSLQLKEKISFYLLPLHRDLFEMQNMLNKNILDSEFQPKFDQFLIESIRYNPQVYMIYFGTIKGNFYGVGHEKKGLALYHMINSSTPPVKIRYILNSQGQITGQSPLNLNFDPRKRPWYQNVVKENKPAATKIYQFTNFDNMPTFIYGVTAAVPIYDRHHRLEGVFGMDLTLEEIQRFINQLHITKNSMVYVTDSNQQIVAYRNTRQHRDIRGEKLTYASVKQYHIPVTAFQLNGHGTVSSFNYQEEEFFLIHQPISGIDKEQLWHITIIVPAKDVLAPLREVSIHAFLLTVFVLLIGALIAHYISQKISNPIIFVAKEAKQMTELHLKPRGLIKTRIKEISYLDESLLNMRSSLISFQRYVPSSLVKKLMKSGQIAEVGGHNQALTVLFSDIANFTSLSEATTPENLMLYLSNYFQSMTESVITYQGTLDKYIGDAIMAIWNAPLTDPEHAKHACQSAVNMLSRIKALNKRNQTQGIPEFKIRIGIDTGEAIVGNVGSEDRLSFTALGDTVNLANRLEGINKLYHTHIIVGEATFKEAAEFFAFRLLDEVAVRGKKNSIAIYELITEQEIKTLPQHREEFIKAFTLYQYGQWKKSLALFKTLTPAYPDDQLANVYIRRCESLMDSPPSQWDGIWRE